MSTSPLLFDLADITAKINLPLGVILIANRGSVAHGTYIPSNDPDSVDDIDLIGVVVGPEQHYFGLEQWGSRGTLEIKDGPYDCVFYEIRKAFSLLLQGNPNILSMLWVLPEDYIYLPSFGRRIVDARQLFVGKHVYNSFAGYASAQLQKMETRDPAELREYLGITYELKNRGFHPTDNYIDSDAYADSSYLGWSTDKLLQRLRSYQKKGENLGYLGEKRKALVLEKGFDSKNASHCIRLLRMAKEFLMTGDMQVYRQDADELLAIKRGAWSLQQIKEHAEQLFMDIKEAHDRSRLPEGPDRASAEKLLISIIRDHLDAQGSLHP